MFLPTQRQNARLVGLRIGCRIGTVVNGCLAWPFKVQDAAKSRTWKVRPMTYVVTDACINCKYMDCVEVCPVDCFYEGENFLVIHPDECIDCGVCEPECPAEAILPDTEPGLENWLEINREYADKWPNITEKGDAPDDADEWRQKTDKLALLSPNPGESPA